MSVALPTSRAMSWLRLCRAGTLFSPAADVIAGACVAGVPWSGDLIRAAGASVCVYAAGMVLNDHADRREDAVRRPERPLPSGAISPTAALAAGLALLATGIAIAPWQAAWAAIAVTVVVYDYISKRSIAAAAPTMGLLRGMNFTAGASFAAGAIPFDGPVPTIAGAYGIYIIAVTVLGALEDEPKVTARAVIGVQSVPPLAFVLGILSAPQRWPALGIALVLAGLFVARVRRRGNDWDRGSIRGSMTWLLLGTMAFTSLLCLGSGRVPEALGIAAAILPARWIARRIALT